MIETDIKNLLNVILLSFIHVFFMNLLTVTHTIKYNKSIFFFNIYFFLLFLQALDRLPSVFINKLPDTKTEI